MVDVPFLLTTSSELFAGFNHGFSLQVWSTRVLDFIMYSISYIWSKWLKYRGDLAKHLMLTFVI